MVSISVEIKQPQAEENANLQNISAIIYGLVSNSFIESGPSFRFVV